MTYRLTTRKGAGLAAFALMLACALTPAGSALAQTTTAVAVRNFEVISVEGNQLVLRDERGTNAYAVPDDFRFTVDGKKMSVSDLKPGMKGTAVVTTTTSVTPVFVTDVRRGTVLSVGPASVTVRDDTGTRKRFTQDQLNDRGVQIVRDGKVIHISQLTQGDEITATFISQTAPVIVTEQEVQATLAQQPPKTESTAAKTESTTPAKTESTSTSTAAAVPATTQAPAAESTATPPAAAVESSGLGTMWYVVIALIIVAVMFAMRRRKET